MSKGGDYYFWGVKSIDGDDFVNIVEMKTIDLDYYINIVDKNIQVYLVDKTFLNFILISIYCKQILSNSLHTINSSFVKGRACSCSKLHCCIF